MSWLVPQAEGPLTPDQALMPRDSDPRSCCSLDTSLCNLEGSVQPSPRFVPVHGERLLLALPSPTVDPSTEGPDHTVPGSLEPRLALCHTRGSWVKDNATI